MPFLRKVSDLKSNPYFQVLKQPEMYLKQISINTLYMGIISFIVNYIYINTSLHEIKISNGLHSLIGFVIALLLVFRTNTAYERWWEGRKQIGTINSKISFIISLLNSCSLSEKDTDRFKYNIKEMLSNTKKYLKFSTNINGDPDFHIQQMKLITKCMQILKKYNNINREQVADQDMAAFNQSFNALMESITSCERIKNTPIPFSYYIHIKICIFLYLITLPFSSVLYELNIWSTPIVMILYFMIFGVEIISEEIENPFSGDPNDLPIDNLIDNIDSIVH